MLSLSQDHNPNYIAKIHVIDNLHPHPNADRLQLTTIEGNNIVLGIDTKIGDMGIYFPLECRISPLYLSANNQFEPKELNADNTKRGFFNKHGRVRACQLRGTKSEGYWAPIDTLITAFGKLPEAVDGTLFDTVYDEVLVSKYVPANQVSKRESTPKGKQPKKDSKIVDGQFRFHNDTAQLGRNVHNVGSQEYVVVTQKLHGTSAVFSHLVCKKPLTWKEKLAKRLGVAVQETYYDSLYSSRRVLKNGYVKDNNHYYGTDIWGTVNDEVLPFIRKGITLYGEIVGFINENKPIFAGYSYGCKPGEHAFYVYRITSTDPDGHVTEFTWEQVKDYCSQFGLKHVPELYKGKFCDLVTQHCLNQTPMTAPWCWDTLDDNAIIEALREKFHNKVLDTGVPDEGICVRIERGMTQETYKLKDFAFLKKESDDLDAEVVSIEDEN